MDNRLWITLAYLTVPLTALPSGSVPVDPKPFQKADISVPLHLLRVPESEILDSMTDDFSKTGAVDLVVLTRLQDPEDREKFPNYSTLHFFRKRADKFQLMTTVMNFPHEHVWAESGLLIGQSTDDDGGVPHTVVIAAGKANRVKKVLDRNFKLLKVLDVEPGELPEFLAVDTSDIYTRVCLEPEILKLRGLKILAAKGWEYAPDKKAEGDFFKHMDWEGAPPNESHPAYYDPDFTRVYSAADLKSVCEPENLVYQVERY